MIKEQPFFPSATTKTCLDTTFVLLATKEIYDELEPQDGSEDKDSS